MSSNATVKLTPREKRKMEREDRKRNRTSQEALKQSTSEKKTPGKEERRTRNDFSSSNGSTSSYKKPPSGAKRLAVTPYEKVNIIEKSPKFDALEKENKGKSRNEASVKVDSSTRRKLGSKFLDNLTKFETQAKVKEEKRKAPFVRSFSSQQQSHDAGPPSFRRSYRPSRSTAAVEDPSILVRRSLRKERVLESIAKLEKRSTANDGTSLKKKPPSPVQKRADCNRMKLTSRPSSASSSKTSLSDSGSSTSSTKGLTRAQQALERHKLRMRNTSQSSQNGSSPTKPMSPAGKTRSMSNDFSRKTPGKSKSRFKDNEGKQLQKTLSEDGPEPRKISVTKNPIEGDGVEVVTVTEVTTVSEGKMSIVVKEHAANEEESEKLLSPVDGTEYQLGDPRPMSVENAVAVFDAKGADDDVEEAQSPIGLPPTPTRVRRTLPEIPAHETSKLKSRRRRSKNKSPEDGSGESAHIKLEEQQVVVIETSPTFQQNIDNPQTLNTGSDQKTLFTFNSNQNSNFGQNLLKQEQHSSTVTNITVQPELIHQQITVEEDHEQEDFPTTTYDPDEAIKMLRRLSEEIHTQPIASGGVLSSSPTSIETPDTIQEQEPLPDSPRNKSNKKSQKRSKARKDREKRPTSLHIEEVLYISEETDDRRPKSSSPLKKSREEHTRSPSPLKHSVENQSRKSSARSPDLSLLGRGDPEATSFSKYPQRSRTPSPQKFSQTERAPRSLPKTPPLPIKSPTSPIKSLPVTPHSPVKTHLSPDKTPSSVSIDFPTKGPKSQDNAPLSQTDSVSWRDNTPESSKSQLKSPESPVKQASSHSPEIIPAPTTARTPSPVKKVNSSVEEEMLMANKFSGKAFAPRYKKSWLDESDSDDNMSLLSDASSDASEIDVKWLGVGSDDDDYVSRRLTKPRSNSSGIQRSASKAHDMLKLWEKKAAEPHQRVRSSPTKQPGEYSNRIGNARAAWESKNTFSFRQKVNETHEKQNGHGVQNGEESPEKVSSTPSSPFCKNITASSPAYESVCSASKLIASEEETKEMQDIFDKKVSGKIQGAKALFENLSQSPNKSPIIGRSPRKRMEEKPRQRESIENSPVTSRNSSITDNAQASRKSSISVVSEASSSDIVQIDQTDVIEESPSVGNMRAMFENQSTKKREIRKHKTSLAEMVAEDDCDITDVRSIKAMWESMDNHRFEGDERKPRTSKSNIQKEVAARKKGRRSMTQPITTDDVMKAKDMVNGSDVNSDAEEEVLNFVDRLKFFNQLSKQTNVQRSRVRRRSDSQPIKSLQVDRVAELFDKEKTENEAGDSKLRTIKSPAKKVPPAEKLPPKSTPAPTRRSTTHVQKLSRKFSVSSSSDNESLLSSSSTSIDDTEPGRKKILLSSSEESNDMSVDVTEIKSTGSIHDRLKRLQNNNAEEKFKKQPRHSEIKSSVSERLNKLKTQDEKWKKAPPADIVKRVDKLSDRIAKMQEDSKTWIGRAGKQNDAAQFTVHAKLAKKEGKNAVIILPSPSMKRRVLPVIAPSRGLAVTETEAKSNDDSSSMSQLSFVEKLAKKGLEENVIKKTEVCTTEVPRFDQEEFEKFFGTTPEVLTNGHAKMDFDIDDLPGVENSSPLSDLGRLKSGVQQQNKRKPSARNPMKALAARTDLKQSYDTERSNIVKLEQQRIAVQRGHGANFTSAALAGLASKADLKNVTLRSAKSTPMPSSDDLKPFKDVMLIRAKGRRKVQTRLVEPCPHSLCSDDAFLLITATKLYAWFGEFCNVIERAKINEIADYIVIKGDLGCKVSSYRSIEEDSDPNGNKEFWDFIGGPGEWSKTTTPGGDEQYEVEVETTIKTYKMIDSKLVPHEESWGKFPKMGMLGSGDTYVFDFGAEMYIWQGKEVSFADRRLAVRLARVLWEQEYDYTKQGVSPFHVEELKGKRPDFGLFARVNENLETSLFQEKFEDWSNIYREVGQDEAIMRETNRGKTVVEIENKSSIACEMEPCDVIKMAEYKVQHAPFLIEGQDVALGDGEIVDEDGRILEILTSSVETFIITENNAEKFSDSVLHRENSYVVKWKYSISSTGRFEMSKSTNGNGSSDAGNGRPRVAYFMWAGSDCATSEKGASALIASSMDTDDGPVITITDATAPPVFDKCFNGNQVVTNGKRGVKRGAFSWKLFRVKGYSQESAALVEVKCECKSLRSSSSFVTMMPRDATAIVWHGCRSPKNVREAAESAIKKMSDRMPESIPFRRNKTCLEISVCEEGEEGDQFWEAVGIKRRNRYECLLDVDTDTRLTRAWKFNIQSGVFTAEELQQVERENLFPLVQEQLTETETPSSVLIDSTHGVFLWQKSGSDALSGAAIRRWDVIRRLSMETTLKYCEEYKLEEARLIEAGSEPTSLTNAFPSWTTNQKSSVELLAQKPRKIRAVLSTLSRLTYSLEELRSTKLPDGVDARHLESYLSTADFEKLFQMTKKEFYKLPAWKQVKLRQEKKFF